MTPDTEPAGISEPELVPVPGGQVAGTACTQLDLGPEQAGLGAMFFTGGAPLRTTLALPGGPSS